MSPSTSAPVRSQRFAPWQMAPLVVTLVVATGLVFYIAGLHWAHGVSQAARGGQAIASNDPSSSGYLQQIPWLVVVLIVLVGAALTPWRAGFGARIAWPGAHRVVRTIRGAVVYALTFTVVGTVSAWATNTTGTTVTSVGEVYGSFDWAARFMSSTRAGLWEETADVAIPIGLAFVVAQALGILRRHPPAFVDVRRVPWWCYLAAAFGLVTRFTDHLYQGPVAASFVVVAGIGAIIVYARYGSVVPLIVGHFLFDAFVAGAPAGLVLPVVVMVAIGAATLIPAAVARLRTP